MNLEDAKNLILSEFIDKNGKLKSNVIVVQKFNSFKEIFRSLLNCQEHLSIATLMYVIVNDIEIKRCKHCNKQLNVYRYSSGYNGKGSSFCSQKCSNEYKHDKTEGELFTNYLALLDKNGSLDSQKIDKHLNNISIQKLKELSGINTDDIATLLYSVLKDKSKIRYCLECGKVIPITAFKGEPYSEKKRFCSKICRNKNSEFIENLRTNNLLRVKSEDYIINVGIPWFEAKIQKIVSEQNVTPLFQYSDVIKTPRQSSYFKFRCNECSREFEARFLGPPICRKCNPNSKPQQALSDYIESFGFKTEINDRILIKPYELDIVIPELKIAIEFDGLHWHQNRDHYHKYLMTQKIGYRLVKVFDDENEEIVRSRIAAIIGKTVTKIYARKCSVIELDYNTYSKFMNENHIQGVSTASVRLGLEYESKLVAVMSFNKPRFNKTIEWELIRFANIINTSVIGGASKLFEYFKKTYSPESVISYCDLRWGTGKMYENLGFEFSHKTSKGYFWYSGKGRESRIKYQKHKLISMFPHADMSLSESQIMEAEGFTKIYDFGNSVYIWSKISLIK